MSCLDELAALADEDLLDFILKADASHSDSQGGEEIDLLENWHPPEPEFVDREMEDFISCMLNPFEDEPNMLQDYLPVESDTSISEDQHQPHSFDSSFAGSSQSSNVLQIDHNYSLHEDKLVLESVRSEMAEGEISTDLEKEMDWESTSKVPEDICGFPTAVAVDAEPWLVPEAVAWPQIPNLVLAEEEGQRDNLNKEGVSLPTYLLQPTAEDQLLKKVHLKRRRKQSAWSCHHRRKTHVKKRVVKNTGLARRLEPAKLRGSKSSSEAQAGEEGAAAVEEQAVSSCCWTWQEVRLFLFLGAVSPSLQGVRRGAGSSWFSSCINLRCLKVTAQAVEETAGLETVRSKNRCKSRRRRVLCGGRC